MAILNKISRLMGPMLSFGINNELVNSKSQKLFSELGLTHFIDGMGILSPFIVRSLGKLERLVRKEMEELSAVEIVLPTLTQWKLYEKSGRKNLTDLYKLQKDSDKSYVLSPTYEESVTSYFASIKTLTRSQLPCRVYQISKKFRNEKRAKSGLLRSKEFLMKDLYSFDADMESNEAGYKEVFNKYHQFFQKLKLPYVCVDGSVEEIGGLYSHEFHILTDAGEDKISLCQECGHNENLGHNYDGVHTCKKCQSKNVKIQNGIEAGHTFNLGTRYSEPFKATYKNKDQKQELLHMSCFGLGLSRILAAAVEVLCTAEEVRWPLELAPYLVCIIPPKAGSKIEEAAGNKAELIYHNLNECLKGDVVIDDRTSHSIGNRLIKLKKFGFPFIIVIGKNIMDEPPLVEVHDVNVGSMNLVQIHHLNQFVLDKLMGNSDDELLKKGNTFSVLA